MKRLILISIVLCFALISFSQQTGSFTDSRDGKTYKTVTIGNQLWMAENLAFKAEVDCYAYDNNQDNVATYGYLYTWECAQEVCPSGWHLPTEKEYNTLLESVGGRGSAAFQQLLPTGNSGFSAQFGGWFHNSKTFKNLGEYALFWTSSIALGKAGYLSIDGRYKIARVFNSNQKYGYSVRCLKEN